MIVENNSKEMIKTLESISADANTLKDTMDIITTDEEKETEEYKKMTKELGDIDWSLKNFVSEEEAESIRRFSALEHYIKELETFRDKDGTPKEAKDSCNRQIRMIRSSIKLDLFYGDFRPTLSSKKLKEKYIKLRKQAEAKLDSNTIYKFQSALNIDKHIKLALPEELKDKSIIVSAFIYQFILNVSLKQGGYSIFVFFLINNINSLGVKPFAEQEEFVKHLRILASEL